MKEQILFSTDIGSDIDDALALLVMLNTNIDLKGIYTVNGNVSARGFIAKHMVDLAKKPIEVGLGESKPTGGKVEPYTFFEDCYIDETFIDEKKTQEEYNITFKSPKKAGIKSEGLEALADQLSDSKKIVLNTGPMTNIAKLIDRYPSIVKNIIHLYIMGCRFNSELTYEHNVRFDIPAATIVLKSDIPVTVIPGDLCSRYKMPINQIEQMQSQVGLYVKRMALGFIGVYTARKFAIEDLGDLIDNEAKMNLIHTKEKQSNQDIIRNLEKKRKLITNLDDPYEATLNPDEYFKQYHQLIEHLRDPKLNYLRGNFFASILELAIPKEISIADVYVPYCLLHPDKIKTEKANIRIDANGFSRRETGDKHSIVTDLNFDHFKDFIKEYLK